MVAIWLGMWAVALPLALDTDVDEDKKPKLKFIFGQHKQAQLLTWLGHLFFFSFYPTLWAFYFTRLRLEF